MNAARNQQQDHRRDMVEEISRLYREHFEELVGLTLRLLDTRHLAEEAVQEAFLKYYAANSGPRRGCELAYLRSIALNNARSMMRRRQTAERWRPETPRYVVAVEDTCIQLDAAALLRARCALLPERQRTVLGLHYWHGLSVAEIADRLAISPGSVKTHASRGREALRRQLVDSAA